MQRASCTHGTSRCRGIRHAGRTTRAKGTTRRRYIRDGPGSPTEHQVAQVGGTQPPSSLPPSSPSACAGVPHTHHATQHAMLCASISWKPGRFLGTPDLVNKTPLHVLARLTSGPFLLPPPSPPPLLSPDAIWNFGCKRLKKLTDNADDSGWLE